MSEFLSAVFCSHHFLRRNLIWTHLVLDEKLLFTTYLKKYMIVNVKCVCFSLYQSAYILPLHLLFCIWNRLIIWRGVFTWFSLSNCLKLTVIYQSWVTLNWMWIENTTNKGLKNKYNVNRNCTSYPYILYDQRAS